jgi:hypothetical protein
MSVYSTNNHMHVSMHVSMLRLGRQPSCYYSNQGHVYFNQQPTSNEVVACSACLQTAETVVLPLLLSVSAHKATPLPMGAGQLGRAGQGRRFHCQSAGQKQLSLSLSLFFFFYQLYGPALGSGGAREGREDQL